MSYSCPDCDRELPTERGRDSHRSQVHDWTRMVEVTCEWCGDKFERKRSIEENSDQTFCSQECHGKFISEHKSGENSPAWEGGPSNFECEVCGSTFEKYESNTSKSIYCSRDCQVEARDFPTGEDHPSWNPDREWWPYYGPNWSEQREKARERDGRCQVCGIPSWAYRCLHGQALDVHHVTPFEEYDDHEEANKLSNLMPLCASCHNTVERGF
jgi:5-methylcytosine-specific restriction endonuclease McrA